MFPLYDNVPSRTTPFVNYGLIGACTLVFFMQLAAQTKEVPSLVERYGMVPARVQNPNAELFIRDQVPVQTPFGIQVQEIKRALAPAAVPPKWTLLTCIFLHGGWMHFLGNVWFLYIFGDNVEDRLGHVAYLLFYLACGILASYAHLLTNLDSPIPTIGASGAIAGVMGAYFYLYPRAQVMSVIPIFIFLHMIVLPAPVFLGIWFVFQVVYAYAHQGTAGGVAWWAHIGGYVVGFLFAFAMGRSNHLGPPVAERRPNSDHSGTYRMRF